MAEQAATGLRAVSARGSRLGLAVGSAFLLQLILAACNAPGVSRASSSPDSTHDPGQVDCPAGKPARSGLQNFGAYIGTWDANHEHDPQVPAEYAIGSIPGRVEVRCSNDGYVVVERIRPQLQSPAGQALRVALTDLPDDAEKVYDHMHAGCRVLQYTSARLAHQLGAEDNDGRVSIVFRSDGGTYNAAAVRVIDLDLFERLGSDTRAC